MYKTFLYSALFIGGGIFGWLLDTINRSYIARKYASGTLVPFFSIIYGVGAVMLYLFFRFANVSFLWGVILGTVLCVAVELSGGLISLLLFRRPFWDYSKSPFNFYGLIDLEHGFYWLVLTTLYRLFFRLLN